MECLREYTNDWPPGDKCWGVKRVTVEGACPACEGVGQLSATAADGTRYNLPCPRCSARGVRIGHRYEVRRYVIVEMHLDQVITSDGVRTSNAAYGAITAAGGHKRTFSEIFKTRDEALEYARSKSPKGGVVDA